MKNFKKSIALLVAVSMIVGCIIGGTLAWLTATSSDVVNTFTTSDISVTLTESDNLNLQMIPGHTITKDPKVTVAGGSEACWLFVKVEESTNLEQFITYTTESGWTALTGVDGVYYRKVPSSTTDTEYSVLANDQVTVKDTVKKTDMDRLKETGATQPTLAFTAYASQLYKTNNVEFTAAEAWNNLGVSPTAPTE